MTTYSYEILSTDAKTGTMEVRYTRHGHEPVLVAVPLPRVGVGLKEIVAAYAPLAVWEVAEAPFAEVEVGASGEMDLSVTAPVADLAAQLRAERDLRLMQTDWIYLPDVTPPEDVASWEAYRQALRDVPQQVGFPGEVRWPVRPGE
jgi:hypothetical protein